MVKLSVIFPVYNMEKYLEKSLESILSQTFKDMEILCVNDGSTDCSLKLLETYAEKDFRIKIINKENGGLSSARNAGLDIAQGEFVSFVDSDDWIEPKTYEKSMEKFTDDIDMVVFQPKMVQYETLETWCPDNFKIKFIGKEYVNSVTIENSILTVWNKIYRKSVIDKYEIRFPEGFHFEDIEFNYKYFSHIKTFYFIGEYFYNYLQRDDSIMGKTFSCKNSKLNDYIKIAVRLYDYRNQADDKELYRKVLNFYLKTAVSCMYQWSEDKNKTLEYISEVSKKFDEKYFEPGLIKLLRTKQIDKLDFKDNYDEELISIKFSKILKNIKLTLLALQDYAPPRIINHKHNNSVLNKLKKIPSRKCNITKPIVREEITSILDELGEFYFCPNFGNLGDVVIAQSEYQLFDSNEYKYKIFNEKSQPKTPFNLVYGGGGLFVNYWNYQDVLKIFKNPYLQKCVILPSSFWLCSDLMEVLDERFTVFCREKKSYDFVKTINKKAKFILADDMALGLDFNDIYQDKNFLQENLAKIKPYEMYEINKIRLQCKNLRKKLSKLINNKTFYTKNGLKVAYFMREDKEKQNKFKSKNNIDISLLTCSDSKNTAVVKFLSGIFIDGINSVDIVITDRLHVGIVSTLLGKKVFLIDNSYGKVAGVYNYSLSKYNNVSLINDISEVKLDEINFTSERKEFL